MISKRSFNWLFVCFEFCCWKMLGGGEVARVFAVERMGNRLDRLKRLEIARALEIFYFLEFRDFYLK